MTKDQVYGKQANRVRPSEVSVTSGSKFIGATFLYMALGLLVTFGVIGLLGAMLSIFKSEIATDTYIYIFIAALILYIPVMIWVHFSAARNGKTVGPAFFTYSIVMGALISPAVLFLDFGLVAVSFGTTCLAFAVMALIAWTSKKSLSNLAIIGMGLLFGGLILSIFNLIMYFIIGFQPLYWLVSFLFFFAIILLTIFDLKRVKEIAMSGVATKNMAMLCALNLYVDFIYIFLRVLRIVAIIAGNRR